MEKVAERTRKVHQLGAAALPSGTNFRAKISNKNFSSCKVSLPPNVSLFIHAQPPEQDNDVRGPSQVGHRRAGRGAGAEERHARQGRGDGVRIRRRIGEASHCQVRANGHPGLSVNE